MIRRAGSVFPVLACLMIVFGMAGPAAAQPVTCADLLRQSKAKTSQAIKSWNAFIEAFNKYAFVPDYSGQDRGPQQLTPQITQIRSLSANASGYIAQAVQMNCKMDPFKPLQTELEDIAVQLDRAVLQLSN